MQSQFTSRATTMAAFQFKSSHMITQGLSRKLKRESQFSHPKRKRHQISIYSSLLLLFLLLGKKKELFFFLIQSGYSSRFFNPFSCFEFFRSLLGLISFEMSLDSSSADHGGHSNIRGVPTHGGRYVQYNVHGSLFEVSRKYVPPIRPIGRGANGMVW